LNIDTQKYPTSVHSAIFVKKETRRGPSNINLAYLASIPSPRVAVLYRT
jgi:hypothetical protein